MRWSIFVLAFLPNLVSADKAARDEVIEVVSSTFLCSAALYPFNEDISDRADEAYNAKVRQNRIIMEFELDENFYSEDNLFFLATRLMSTILFYHKAAFEKWKQMSESERQYIDIKVKEIRAKNAPIQKQFMDDPKFHAGFIRQCAESYDLIW